MKPRQCFIALFLVPMVAALVVGAGYQALMINNSNQCAQTVDFRGAVSLEGVSVDSSKITYYDAHLVDTSNPHTVTAAQIGGGNIVTEINADTANTINANKLSITSDDLGADNIISTINTGSLKIDSPRLDVVGLGLGDMLAANNLSDLDSVVASKANLSLENVENTKLSTWAGTSKLTTLGTISTGTWAADLISVSRGGTGASSAANARTSLGIGTMGTQSASSVSITGGSVSGITDLAIADGGTGASTAETARLNLGLGTMATQSASSVSITGGSVSGITDLAIAGGAEFAGEISGPTGGSLNLSGKLYINETSGDVSIGTDSTAAYNAAADDQIIEGSTTAGTTWSVDGSGTGNWIYNLFTDKTAAATFDGYISYNPYYNIFRLACGGVNELSLEGGGGLYTGGTSSSYNTIASGAYKMEAHGKIYGGATPGSGNNRLAGVGVINQASDTDSGTGYFAASQEDGSTWYWWIGNDDVARISATQANIGTTTGTVIGSQTSDRRLKRDIAPIDYDLSTVRAVSPVSFYFVNPADPHRHLGFIAQELENVVPESVYDTGEKVSIDPDGPNQKGMDRTELIAVLWKAVQILDQRVKDLEDKIKGD